jgi:hypothetical protein
MYSHAVIRLARPLCLLLACESAFAGGLVTTGSPRSIGRAGTATVGDDGGGALLCNPAAMARRDGKRAEVGLMFVDDEIAWQSSAEGAPVVRDQAPSSVAPYAAAFGSIGGWTIGLGVMTAAVSDRSLRRPGDVADPTNIDVAFDFRYAGIAGGMRRDTVTAGIARRFGDSVALGIGIGASRVSIIEIRRMWAGFSGRDDIGNAANDLEIGFEGADAFVPSAIAGVLFVPEDTQLELGASIGWVDTARIKADVAAVGTRPMGPSPSPDTARATLDYRHPITARAGARYVGDRIVGEVGGEVARARRGAQDVDWRVSGMQVIDGLTGLMANVERVPSRVSMRTHGAVRASVDVELIAGFLWGTAGYAHVIGSVTKRKQSPTFGELGGETLGLGLEGRAGGFTFTLGWSRTWAAAREVTTTNLALDNPFVSGDSAVPAGSYDGSVDQIGILIDVELDPLE